MRRRALASVLSVGIAAAALIAAGSAAAESPEKLSEAAAGSWLALVDSQKYAESWKEASEMFRRQVTAEQWQRAVEAARSPLGKLVSRTLSKAEFTRTLPGAPDGEYVVLTYASELEKKKSATETVVTTKEKQGEWRVAGYFVR